MELKDGEELVGTGFSGRVKWFNDSHGYGFIVGDGYDGDIFVYFNQIEPWAKGFKTLKDNELVEYSLVKTGRGIQAFDVKKIPE